jgi:exodeoxyribonuclease V alpha subunit
MENPLTDSKLEETNNFQNESEGNLNFDKSTYKDFLRGTIKRITFRSEETGFAVVRVEPEGNSKVVETLVGKIPTFADEGSSFIARGIWQKHDKFGRQFKAVSFSEAKPTSLEAITKYLSSGQVKGIGEKLAERIVAHFGDRTIEILDTAPEELSQVPGLGQSKVEELCAVWSTKKEEREVMLFFQNYGIGISVAKKIFATYKSKAIETVKTNPYVLCHSVWGIGFLTADKIARALGIDSNSEQRLVAGLNYTLTEAQTDGHTYFPKEILLEKASSLLTIPNMELLDKALNIAIFQGLILEYQSRYYTPPIFLSERKAADSIVSKIKNLSSVSKSVPSWILDDILQSRKVDGQNLNPIILSDEQKEAVKLAANSNLLVITGGPGCGKTTVVKSITSLFKKAGFTIKLAAPTGRAAQRLQEVCGIEASTIHRLLKYDPIQRNFLHDESDPLAFDVLIIDESSMIDIQLAASLLKSVPKNMRLIFVGDKDQLPSVGPGLFFPDLIELKDIPKVTLNRLFRRAEDSSINEIAHQINQGIPPNIPEPDGTGTRDAYFLPIKKSEDGAELIERLVCDQIPKKFNIPPEDIMVLSPMNQGELGIISLNEKLQKRLVPHTELSPCVQVGNLEFRLRDRVCQRVNNYNLHDAGVFNGEQGVVVGIDNVERKVIVRLWDGRDITYNAESLSQLDLAYALTIHRSQGSEVPVIVLVLHDSHSIMLERQLVYTGVTRAKKLLIVVGTRSALSKAAKRVRSSKRYTSFKDLVLEELK